MPSHARQGKNKVDNGEIDKRWNRAAQTRRVWNAPHRQANTSGGSENRAEEQCRRCNLRAQIYADFRLTRRDACGTRALSRVPERKKKKGESEKKTSGKRIGRDRVIKKMMNRFLFSHRTASEGGRWEGSSIRAAISIEWRERRVPRVRPRFFFFFFNCSTNTIQFPSA